MKTLEKEVLEVIRSDARLTAKQIAATLGASEADVKACIDDLENTGAIVKYTAIVNGEKTDETLVEALIEVKVTPKSVEGFDGIAKQIAAFPEVKGVYLMSGACKRLQDLFRKEFLRSTALFRRQRTSS